MNVCLIQITVKSISMKNNIDVDQVESFFLTNFYYESVQKYRDFCYDNQKFHLYFATHSWIQRKPLSNDGRTYYRP